VNWVIHTHPIAVNGILCSGRAADFANQRMFPDEIVCCGQKGALLPYTDPGLPLAKAIKPAVEGFRAGAGVLPRVILLTNHGMIAPAATAAGAMAATLMAVKAAEIFNIAAAHGGPVFLNSTGVHRIESRKDEHHRRKELGFVIGRFARAFTKKSHQHFGVALDRPAVSSGDTAPSGPWG